MFYSLSTPVHSVILIATAYVMLVMAFHANAHHSFTVYDMDTQIEYSGTVKVLRFRNPHISMTLAYTGQGGEEEIVEFTDGGPANMFIRLGLKPDKIKPGASITVIGSPRKDDPGVLFLRTIIVDGERFNTIDSGQPPENQ